MKNISFLWIVVLLIACEPDDVCSENTQTTSRLVIEFFDIGNLEIRDMNLKESKREFIDILHELGHGYNEKEWHLLKYIES